MEAVLPGMEAAKHGAIVSISSVNGLRGTLGMAAYDAGKWAVRGMNKSVSLEYAGLGIRINTVHPHADAESRQRGKMAQSFGIAFGRVGSPEEVARASLFLASDDASYISGAGGGRHVVCRPVDQLQRTLRFAAGAAETDA